jgi:hypothetical protein
LGRDVYFPYLPVQGLGPHIPGPGCLPVVGSEAGVLNIGSFNDVGPSQSVRGNEPDLVDFGKLWVDLREGRFVQMLLESFELVQELRVLVLDLVVISFKREQLFIQFVNHRLQR